MQDSIKQEVVASDGMPISQKTAPPLNGLSDLWQHTLGDDEITIAILDGPCDLTHPSFNNSDIKQIDLMEPGIVNGPASEHGTHVASIIFGNHESSVKGLAPQCRGLVIPIFRDDSKGGIAPCSQPDLARAIRVALNAGANVINVSGGQYSYTGIAHPMLKEVVQECHQQGRLIVASAGNDGCSCLHVPGALPTVLTVGAMDDDGEPMEFSNWGSEYQNKGLLAPGVNILGALPGNRVTTRTGTSFATPIISGVVALLLSLQKAHGLEPNVQIVRDSILESALGCEYQKVSDCRRLLAGRLDIMGAVKLIYNFKKNQIKGRCGMPEILNTTKQINLDEESSRDHPTYVEGEPVSTLNPQIDEASAKEKIEDVIEKPNVVASENVSTKPNVETSPAIVASACSCQKNGELVYAIGGLTTDFGTLARVDSLQQTADTFDSGGHLNIRNNSHLVRHLLGWKETFTPKSGSGKAKEKVRHHKPHLYDAKDVIWVLTQDESPIYAIQPSGDFSEEGYFELVHFLMEFEGYADDHSPLDSEHDIGPLNMFTHPSLDTHNGQEPNRSISKKTGRVVPIIERIAVPGKISGTAQLMNGMEIPVISPNMRGTKSWNLNSILDIYTDYDPNDTSEAGKDKYRQKLLMERITRRLFEESRNKGIAGEERALNFAATQSFQIALNLGKKFKVEWETDLEGIDVKPSPTCRKDSECYDVNVSFFDAENIMRSKMVLRYTIDVSDVVPVLLGEPQHFRSR